VVRAVGLGREGERNCGRAQRYQPRDDKPVVCCLASEAHTLTLPLRWRPLATRDMAAAFTAPKTNVATVASSGGSTSVKTPRTIQPAARWTTHSLPKPP
jgi:hypothetical protein